MGYGLLLGGELDGCLGCLWPLASLGTLVFGGLRGFGDGFGVGAGCACAVGFFFTRVYPGSDPGIGALGRG